MTWLPLVVFSLRDLNVHCNEFQGLSCRENLQLAIPFQASPVFRAFTTFTDRRLNVVGHMLQVKLTSHIVSHAALARVSGQLCVVRQVEEVWSKRVYYHGLYGVV